jgi:hypothetical protein
VCAGVGIGSIVTTVYRNGSAEKIPNLDTTTNEACTYPGDGSATSGAAAFWVKDGEVSTGGTPADTAQGNCMTCHDVHWALADTAPDAEPFRRECTNCHSHPDGEASAANAPQIALSAINHLHGAGTPLEHAIDEPAEACEICHMPKSSAAQGSSPMHLWRISTDSAYTTMGAGSVNTSPAGAYANAAWVDLDHACGQCHGGGSAHAETTGSITLYTTPGDCTAAGGSWGAGTCSLNTVVSVASTAGFAAGARIRIAGAGEILHDAVREDFESYIGSVGSGTITLVGAPAISVAGEAVIQNPTKNGANYRTRAALARVADGMHASAGVSYAVTFSTAVAPDSLDLSATASVSCGGPCPSFTYGWTWGDGTTSTTVDPVVTATHPYAAAGQKNVTLTVMLDQPSSHLVAGWATQSLTLANPDLPPTAGAICTWSANNWTMTVVDASADDGPDGDTLAGDGNATVQTVVEWGDGSLRSIGTGAGRTYTHVYTAPGGPFVVTYRAIDSKLRSTATVTCPAPLPTPAYFAISGAVKRTDNTTPFGGVAVTLKKSGVPVKSVTTGTNGAYNLGSLKPGTYTVGFTRAGYTFPVLGPYTIGPSVNTADVKANSALGSTPTAPRTRLSTVE